MRLIVLALCSYLIGGINPAYLLTRRKKGVDIRSCGTGNAGATNAMFALGFKPALVVMLLDVCKAALCVLAGRYLVPGNVYAAPLAGLVCTLGHIFPVWLRFRGGKGVACMCGTILALTPALVLPLLAAAFVFGVICNRASLVPAFTATAYVPMYYFLDGEYRRYGASARPAAADAVHAPEKYLPLDAGNTLPHDGLSPQSGRVRRAARHGER